MKYFLLEENIISVLEDFKLTCSPNVWAISSWFLPQEFDTASTDHMEQVLSHRTVCFDSPKWSIQVTLAVQELSNVSMSTLCKEHAEANLHPRSEPRFFQKSDIEHNFLDFCRPWLRSILRSWQHDACECPTQDQWEIIAASCSQTLFFDLWLVTEIVQIHFTAVHISKLRSTKLPVEIAITCFWYFVLGKKILIWNFILCGVLHMMTKEIHIYSHTSLVLLSNTWHQRLHVMNWMTILCRE